MLQNEDEFLSLLLIVKFTVSNNLRNSCFLCKYANSSWGPVPLQLKSTNRYLRTYRWLISGLTSRSLLLVVNYCANIKKLCGSLQIPVATENTYYKMVPFSWEVFHPKSPDHALLSYVGISLKLLSKSLTYLAMTSKETALFKRFLFGNNFSYVIYSYK